MTIFITDSAYHAYASMVNHQNQKWWHDLEGQPIRRNKQEMLMLTVSELGEALEGMRKDLNDDHLPLFKMEHVEIADCVIRMLDYIAGWDLLRHCTLAGIRVEQELYFSSKDENNKAAWLMWITRAVAKCSEYVEQGDPVLEAIWANAIIARCLLYANRWGIDNLWEIVEEKCRYNLHRLDHTIEHRKGEHGKKL